MPDSTKHCKEAMKLVSLYSGHLTTQVEQHQIFIKPMDSLGCVKQTLQVLSKISKVERAKGVRLHIRGSYGNA
jgi:hypothetical protein